MALLSLSPFIEYISKRQIVKPHRLPQKALQPFIKCYRAAIEPVWGLKGLGVLGSLRGTWRRLFCVLGYYKPQEAAKLIGSLQGYQVQYRSRTVAVLGRSGFVIWEFPKIRDTFFGGPYNKDPTI